MHKLLQLISKCSICEKHLELGPRPVVTASIESKIAIIGQAPGSIVHQTGIPWDDKSGERLREWLDIDKSEFYNTNNIALIPMGFCYPGKGKSGDLPPRPECAPKWHNSLLEKITQIELIILVGSYAQNYYLKESRKKTLTETVKNYTDFLPRYLVLPHPSPRNNIWLKKNTWFETELIPVLRKIVSKSIHQ